jgi:hypothetical protein
MTGFGVALTGAAVGDQRLVAAGLLAATLQVIAHTLAKSLLFSCGATVEAAAGTSDLDGLRGAARRTLWSGTGFAVGALTLAGLPLTAGFVSEWFLLESLMQQFRVPGLGYRLALAVAGAAVALTVGFAGVTFVRLTGLVVLGPAPAPRSGQAVGRDYGWLGRAGVTALAVACLGAARADPAGDPDHRLRAVPADPSAGDRRCARHTLGAGPGVPWLLGTVALLAVDSDASPARGRHRGHPARHRHKDVPGAPRAAVALGHRWYRRGPVHRLRLHQPHPPRARRRSAHPHRTAQHH